MVQVRVAAVALDAERQHVVLLKPIDELPGEGRLLPIWIGAQEATSILVAIEGAPVPRPLAHDLMRGMLEASGVEVSQVEVARLVEGTFYAEVSLATGEGPRVVDARPSDAVALASRVGAPIWVADEVMAEAGMPDNVTNAEDEEEVGESLDEFRRFLDDVDPDDFR